MSMEKSVFERLLSLETPVYYYDMDLLKDTVDSLAETAAAHGVKVHYAVKTNNGFQFDLTSLGYGANESVPVYDIWAKQQLEPATGTLSTTVPSHGTRLFRLGDKTADKIESVVPSTDRSGDDAYYTLSGLQVSSPSHGIYIHEGKKVLK